jgi:hypothetical protein
MAAGAQTNFRIMVPEMATSNYLTSNVSSKPTPSFPIPVNKPFLLTHKVQGDFNGDGKKEWAIVVLTKKGHGNPIEDGVPDEYVIKFSNNVFPQVSIGCCEAKLINEGDLIGDKKDKLSVFQAGMNGNARLMTTYALVAGAWKDVIGPTLISNGGDPISDKVINNLVFANNGVVYVNEQDGNSERSLSFIKKRVTLKLK